MPRVFARISEGKVTEFIQEIEDIEQEWHPEFLKSCVEITEITPKPEIGWLSNGKGVLSEPPPFKPSPEQQMAAALIGGLSVESTNTPSLNAVYHTDGQIWERLRDQLSYVAAFDSFVGEEAELEWPTKDGGKVVFKEPAKFKAVARALYDWRALWQKYVDGRASEPPKNNVTIS